MIFIYVSTRVLDLICDLHGFLLLIRIIQMIYLVLKKIESKGASDETFVCEDEIYHSF